MQAFEISSVTRLKWIRSFSGPPTVLDNADFQCVWSVWVGTTFPRIGSDRMLNGTLLIKMKKKPNGNGARKDDLHQKKA